MKKISQHNVLLAGDSFDHCSAQVHKFFDLTTLVIYDCIEAIEDRSISGLDAAFLDHIIQAEKHNRRVVQELIAELAKTGIKGIEDLQNVEQGYVSKTCHILSHFLDGFIGIDSYFYNLLDDSHWLPPATARIIQQDPKNYWLIHIDCFATTTDEVSLLHI